MNERIKELEKQATEIVRCGLNGTSTAESFNRKKFAELIVSECARIASNADLEDVEGGDSSVLCAAAEQIKQHFGVV